jgi:hypothetical protein
LLSSSLSTTKQGSSMINSFDELVDPAISRGPVARSMTFFVMLRRPAAGRFGRLYAAMALVFLFRFDPASFTPSVSAFCRVAPTVRLSLRATTVVFVFSRAMVFNIWTSSLVQGSRGFLFFTIGRFISGVLASSSGKYELLVAARTCSPPISRLLPRLPLSVCSSNLRVARPATWTGGLHIEILHHRPRALAQRNCIRSRRALVSVPGSRYERLRTVTLAADEPRPPHERGRAGDPASYEIILSR